MSIEISWSARPTASTPTTAQPSGMRMTRQRRAVIETLNQHGPFASAQAIHVKLQGSDQPVGLSTVYRILQALASCGEVDTVRTSSGEVLYRRCNSGDHHHLVCRVCGTTVEIEGALVESWAAQQALENGFHDVSHTLEIFGTCRRCYD